MNRTRRLLPPPLQLLLDEVEPGLSISEQRRKLKTGLLGELQDQSVWAFDNWTYSDRQLPPADLSLVAPGDALNPLVGVLKCSSLGCRAQVTESFGRYIALYTDGAVLPDYATHALRTGSEDVAINVIRTFLPQLRLLLPLIDAGLLRFGTPTHANETSDGEAHKMLDEAVVEMLREHRSAFQFIFLPEGKWGEVHVANKHVFAGSEPFTRIIRLTKKELGALPGKAHLSARGPRTLPAAAFESLAERLALIVSTELHGMLIQAHTASKMKATLMVGAPAETYLMRRQGATSDSRLSRRVEQARTLRLPWMRDLSTSQAVTLRSEAGTSLERLRGRLQRAAVGEESEIEKAVSDLNDEAGEVGAELRAIRLGTSRVEDSGFASLGIGLVLYGLANSNLVAAVAGLGAMLAKLRDETRTRREEIARQTARPGYALLKARQLLGGRRVDHDE